MDEERQQRFKEAVERKAQQSEAASRATQQGRRGEAGAVQGDQESLRSPGQPQDTYSVL